ncbi:MAG: cupin domain-containing protein [Saprospiraceae bacterium]
MSYSQTINLQDKYQQINEHWSPKIIGELNGQHVKLAKISGEFVWHSHENEDELFMVIKGKLFMDFRDRTEIVQEGEIIIVPKGVEHRPRTENEEVQIMLFEPAATINTGGVVSNLTKENLEKI